jgi:sulfur relay protein TusB/DsrH
MTLHVIRKTHGPLAAEAMESERRQRPVALLLIQDGVLAKGDFPEETYVCAEDQIARGIQRSYQAVDYTEMARLILKYDRVIVW